MVPQAADVITEHVPVTEQQAPVHGLGVQVVPAPIHTLGVVQADCSVTVQPVELQQAPVGFGCGHGFGEQVVHSPCQL